MITKNNIYYFLFTLGMALFFFLIRTYLPEISIKGIPAIIFLISVIYAGLQDGIISATLNAAIAELYFMYSYSTPGKLFHYTSQNFWRVIVIGITLFALAYILGNFKQKISKHIHSEKLARQKAEETSKKLQALDAQKEKYISIASHELKTPITSLKLFTHMLKKKAEKGKDMQTGLYVKKIDNQVNSLISLTTNLLDASRITTGKLNLNRQFFNINDLIDEKIDEIASMYPTRKIIKKGSTTKKIFADKNYISQVIINLLTNAIRYSPDEKDIIVRIKKDEQILIISVQDFGIGIKKQHQKKIFDQFYQIDTPVKNMNKGLGIGLYISSQIIKYHGGKIQVKSSDHGSTFSFSLPIA